MARMVECVSTWGCAVTDRWDALFGDLEAELAAADAAELRSEVADRSRREYATLRLVDRLRPALGHTVSISVLADVAVTGRLTDLGSDWVLVAEAAGSAVVPLPHIRSVAGLGAESSAPGSEGKVAARLDLRHALRRLARNRAEVVLTTVDRIALSGTLDRVGADFVEIAQHHPGQPRRKGSVRQVLTVPIAAIALVRAGVRPGS